MVRCKSALILTLSVGMLPFLVRGSTAYDEAISGDLSGSGLSPTPITLTSGSNDIFGTTGRGATALDRDYFTVTVPSGLNLSAISVLPGTISGGAVSFIGLQAGNQVTVATSATDATGLLGWWHYGPSDIGTDILPEMAAASQGSSGFEIPLPSGMYSLWIQDFNAGAFTYGFDLTLTSGSPDVSAPEPTSYGLLLVTIAATILVRRWRMVPRK